MRDRIPLENNARALRTELDRLLHDTAYRARMDRDLKDLKGALGGPGASTKAATLLWKSLKGAA